MEDNDKIILIIGIILIILASYVGYVNGSDTCPECDDCSLRPAGTIRIVENHTCEPIDCKDVVILELEENRVFEDNLRRRLE